MTNTKLSRRISYLLRHDPDMIDENGWADVSAVVWKMKGVFGPFDEELLETIVAEDEKGRYSYNEDRTKIRANQGHSVPLAADAVGMVCLGPPEYLYHGTAQDFLPSILKEGFKPLQPLAIYRDTEDNTKLTIRFLVPQLPLVFDTNIVTKQPEYGFQVYNNGNRVMIKDFKIVGDCVEIYAGARLIGDVEVIYGSLDTGGHGNLRDSDDYEAAFPYIDVDEKDKNDLYIYPRKDDKPLRPAYEPKDEKGQVIYNRPYPLYNFCVAFYYKLPQGTNRLDIPMQGTSTLTLPAEKDVKVTASEGWLHIVAPQDLTLNHVGVYDLAGRPMLQISSIGNGQKDYDLSTLPQGLYVVHIDTSNGVLSQKVILQ